MKNKLHKHLRSGCSRTSPASKTLKKFANFTSNKLSVDKENEHGSNVYATSVGDTTTTTPIIVPSKASTENLGFGLGFRNWNFIEGAVKFTLEGPSTDCCLDTGCGSTLGDREWISRDIPNAKVHLMANPLRVRGIGSNTHETKEYILVPFYMPASKASDGTSVLACITREIHIVDGLKANMLIRNDVLGPEEFVIDINKKKAYIGSCDVNISLQVRPRGTFIRKTVRTKSAVTVTPGAELKVPVNMILPADRDFLFEPTDKANVTLYYHLVDALTAEIVVRNDSPIPVELPRKFRLGQVSEVNYNECFHIADKDLVTKPPKASWFKKAFTAAAFLTAVTMDLPTLSLSSFPPEIFIKVATTASCNKYETKLANMATR